MIIKSVTDRKNVEVTLDEALDFPFGQTWEIIINGTRAFISSKVLHDNAYELIRYGQFDFEQLETLPDHAFHNPWEESAGYIHKD